jgi:hypothetical protein
MSVTGAAKVFRRARVHARVGASFTFRNKSVPFLLILIYELTLDKLELVAASVIAG